MKLANHSFKEVAEHFNRNPVVISKGIKGLEKKIREDETIASAITLNQESLAKNRKKTRIYLSQGHFPEYWNTGFWGNRILGYRKNSS